MGQELINSIRDLKYKVKQHKIEEVIVRHPHPRELLDDLINEINRDRFEGRFENSEHLIHYLRYLLDTRHNREHERTPDRDYRHIRCECGTVTKVTIEPEPNRYYTHTDTTRHEYWCGFFCSGCGIKLRTNARKICRVETEEIDDHVNKAMKKEGWEDWI
jgi:hypothetical protein